MGSLRPKKWLRRLEQRLLPGRARERRRRKWEATWSREDLHAPWLDRGVSKEIAAAVEEGWFPAGRPVLDIGCGQGEVAQWFAERGFPTLGVDLASAAIERARRRYGETPGRLEFAVLDLVRQAPPDRRFGILVDRGCFHSIHASDARAFVENLASVSAPDARMLLFIRAFRGDSPLDARTEREAHEREVEAAFGGAFEILRCEETFLDPYDGQRPDHYMPGLVFWMRRR